MTSLYYNPNYNLPRISLYNNPSQNIPYNSIPQYYELNQKVPMTDWNTIKGTYLPSFSDFQNYAVRVANGLDSIENQGILQKGGTLKKKSNKKHNKKTKRYNKKSNKQTKNRYNKKYKKKVMKNK